MFKFISKNKISDLPNGSGVYAFKKAKDFLYIGKAVNIKGRVKNHFQQPVFKDSVFVPVSEKIGYIQTNSEIEALLLEAELIKKFQPKYNQQWKDSKNYFYVVITKEEFPRVYITHQIQNSDVKYQIFARGESALGGKFKAQILKIPSSKKRPKVGNLDFDLGLKFGFCHLNFCSVGPFVDGGALKQSLRVLRKVFPYRTCRIMPKKSCLYKELGVCLAPCLMQKSEIKNQNDRLKYKKRYQGNIKKLAGVLKGGKEQVLYGLEKEMKEASKRQDFEGARELRDQIWVLKNVFQHSHILDKNQYRAKLCSSEPGSEELQKILKIEMKINRIEGYDISNIQGQQATGSMVVFENAKPNKAEYRKFKIKISGKPNDTAMIQEILERRFKHREWGMPQVILIDGGKAQLNAGIKAKYQISNFKFQIKSKIQMSKLRKVKIISLAKRKNELFIENKEKPVLLKDLPQETANLILAIRDEAHRFAITYHKKLRMKSFLK